MNNFNKHFLEEDDGNFEVLVEQLDYVHHLLSERMSNGFSYFGQPQFDAKLLKNFENIPFHGRETNEVMGGLADALTGQLRWNANSVLHNINPPASIDAIAAACIANIYNPNPLWDFVSSGSQEMEKQVVRQMSRLIGWEEEEADGVFTFGGKGCLTYAVKLGINRAVPGNALCGLVSATRKEPVVISSDESHYSLDTVCSLLGIGTVNSIRIPTDEYGAIRTYEFASVYNKLVDEGHPIAAIIVNGGNTLNNSSDDLAKMLPIIVAREADLGYRPYIHYDMVITWAWLFFQQYDDKVNVLGIETDVLARIRKLSDLVATCRHADSVGIDFHKTGFTPYISSLFVTRTGAALHSIFKPSIQRLERKDYGNNFLQHHTIEHSRTSGSIFSAWAALQSIGVEGFQYYIANLMTVAAAFRRELSKQGFECLNPFSMAFAGSFFPIYQGMLFDEVQTMTSTEEVNNYVYRLFEFFYKGDHEYSKYVLGFLPQCGKNHSGKPISGLRVFPMSASITPEKAVEISKELGKMKATFDGSYDFGNIEVIESQPTHVPK